MISCGRNNYRGFGWILLYKGRTTNTWHLFINKLVIKVYNWQVSDIGKQFSCSATFSLLKKLAGDWDNYFRINKESVYAIIISSWYENERCLWKNYTCIRGPLKNDRKLWIKRQWSVFVTHGWRHYVRHNQMLSDLGKIFTETFQLFGASLRKWCSVMNSR